MRAAKFKIVWDVEETDLGRLKEKGLGHRAKNRKT
jgi:hypothetical protein